MYRPNFFTLALCLIASGSARADQTYTLAAAVEAASHNSPILQKADAQKDQGNWKGIEGVSVFLPSLTFSGTHFFEKKFQILNTVSNGNPVEFPQIFPSSSATLEAKWLIFDGFSNISNYKAAQSIRSASEFNYSWVRFQLEREVTLAYLKVISAKKLEDVASQNLKTLQNHLDQVKNLKAGGLATHYDILKVESQLSAADADLLFSKDNTVISQEHLGQVLGLNESVDASENELAEPNAEAVKKLSFSPEANKRLDLQALEAQVKASDNAENAYSHYWLPKVGLNAQYIKYNNLSDSLSDWQRYRNAWNVGFVMSWDLFNPRAYALSRQETYKAIEMQKSLVQANLQAPVDFAFWKRRYLYSATLFNSKKVDLDRANETVRLSQAGFKAGVRTTTDVLDSELDLFRARAGIVNAQLNCLEAKIKLELALGEKL